ncbi:MAG: hypothetical protein FFIRV1_gp2 [Frankliniella intonsa rhabdovirus 1]|uniref:Uncharacterized protein n=1 Tax=Frankliniella intonsa rhabdovirus 1 TaxID=3070917 RepID=A0A8K1XBB1_9RHAB|nr:MAG: hypothetical protein QKV04_gp2 [Frankliniella intonsa rhabdovirus 1]UHK03323.1 MAG: hypothetical protein FFIRV1_gp2 [Frankliniella intonsa rhabdovirus 1]
MTMDIASGVALTKALLTPEVKARIQLLNESVSLEGGFEIDPPAFEDVLIADIPRRSGKRVSLRAETEKGQATSSARTMDDSYGDSTDQLISSMEQVERDIESYGHDEASCNSESPRTPREMEDWGAEDYTPLTPIESVISPGASEPPSLQEGTESDGEEDDEEPDYVEATIPMFGGALEYIINLEESVTHQFASGFSGFFNEFCEAHGVPVSLNSLEPSYGNPPIWKLKYSPSEKEGTKGIIPKKPVKLPSGGHPKRFSKPAGISASDSSSPQSMQSSIPRNMQSLLNSLKKENGWDERGNPIPKEKTKEEIERELIDDIPVFSCHVPTFKGDTGKLSRMSIKARAEPQFKDWCVQKDIDWAGGSSQVKAEAIAKFLGLYRSMAGAYSFSQAHMN